MQTQRGDCFLYLRFIHSGWLRLFLVLFFFLLRLFFCCCCSCCCFCFLRCAGGWCLLRFGNHTFFLSPC